MMNVALAKTETGRALSDIFAIARDRLPGAGKVAETRQQAFEAYERAGLPHRRIEDWKYTDLRVLMREVLPLAAAPDAAALKRAGAALKLHAIAGVRRLVLVDGVFAPKLSDTGDLEKGLGIRTLREVLEAGDAALHAQLFAPDSSDPMVALNSAMMTDGVVIEVADGAALTQPLHIVHIASGAQPAAMFTRSLLQVGKAASATLVESYIAAEGAKAYQVHDSLVLAIGDGARLDHVRLIEDGREAFNISSVGGDARRQRAFQHLRHDQRRRMSAAIRPSSRSPARARRSRPTASICSMAASTPTPRCFWIMRCRTARAAKSSAPWSTIADIRCFRAASSFAPRRRRPTPR